MLSIIRNLPRDAGYVYLSFDDGPDIEWTPRVLDLLASAGAQATFFMLGCRARLAPALVRRVITEGHAVGNHGFSHRHPWTLSAREARNEVHAGAAAIADACGQAPRLFRPPHGRLRPAMVEAAADLGPVVLWTRSAIDWGWLGTAGRIAARLERTQPGDIVLMHDARNIRNNPNELVRVLPVFLHNLTAGRGCRCPTIPQDWPPLGAESGAR